MSAFLEFSKFQVTTAANVGEVQHLIDTQPFDVLLIGLHMPEAGDGLPAARQAISPACRLLSAATIKMLTLGIRV
jgi:DNA-binding response OmpR family regulator